VPQLTVEENLFLSAELMEHRLLDKGAMHAAKARAVTSASAFP
jgi:ABC-type sugar transport system ATPase subunit